MSVRRLPVTLFFAISTLGLGGCILDRVVWLPDSSGFVYSLQDDGGKVIHYDLRSRGRRVVADLPSQKTRIPAVSPDGKRVALVRIERSKDWQRAQIILLNLDGKMVHESEFFPFGDGDRKLSEITPRKSAAEWSARGDHLLIADEDGLLGAYDVKGKSFRVFSGVEATILEWFYDGAIARDGSGFLANRKGSKGDPDNPFAGVVFVDWEGSAHDLKTPPETLAALKKIEQEEKAAKTKSRLFQRGSWEGPVAVQPYYRGVIWFDCARRTVSYAEDAKIAAEFERARREGVSMTAAMAGGELIVQARATTRKAEQGDPDQIEVWGPKDGTRRTLVENISKVLMFSAPDGKATAILYRLKDESKERILVVDEKGSLLSNFEVE